MLHVGGPEGPGGALFVVIDSCFREPHSGERNYASLHVMVCM